MAPQQQPAGRAISDIEPEDDWRRYSVERSGNGFAVASAIIGTLGVIAGVNIWTFWLVFVGWLDLIAPVLLGAMALILAALGRADTGRRLRIVGFVAGGIAVILGLAFLLRF